MMNKITENRINRGINQFTMSIFSIFLVMLTVWLILLPISKYNGNVLFKTFFYDPFVDADRMKEVILLFSPFLIGSLAVLMCFRMNIINLGISGQMSCTALVVYFTSYWLKQNDFLVNNPWVGTVILCIVGISAATLLGLLCGALRVYFNVNEVLSTIMINYIVFYVFRQLVRTKEFVNSTNLGTREPVGPMMEFNHEFLSILSITLIFGLIVYIIGVIMLQRSRFGLMINVVGHNLKAARYGGINLNRMTMKVFALSGVLAGIAGIFYYYRDPNDTYLHISEALPNNGFDTITIVWLSQSSIVALPITSFFVAIIRAQQKVIKISSLDPVIVEIVIGLLILTIAFLSKVWLERENKWSKTKMWFRLHFPRLNRFIQMKWLKSSKLGEKN